jgi:hypothetical protein
MNLRYYSATVGTMLKNWRGQDEGEDPGKDKEGKQKKIFK